ncbi:MAG: hypothetical protein SGJ27_28340 [Candidatus Melainabacteria bacterium]|nr:hypothetical protein [Candidatus Melainabacteria bacterium]
MVDEKRSSQADDLDDDDDGDDEVGLSPVKNPRQKPQLVYVLVAMLVVGIISAVYFFGIKDKEIIPDELVPIKVLIVGNDTLHLNDVPNMVREVATMSKSWRPLEVSCVAREDYSLSQHVDEAAAQKLIADNDFDFVVLQDRWLQPLQDPGGMLESTRALAQAARKKGSRVVLFIPWADAGENKRQEVLSSVSRKLAERLSIDVAPAGDVFFAVVKKHKEINPYVSDKHHVSSIGAWLAAATLYSVVTGQKPKLKADQFTYQSGDGEEPQVPVVGDVATDVETIVWETVTQQNPGKRLGPTVAPAPQKTLELK